MNRTTITFTTMINANNECTTKRYTTPADADYVPLPADLLPKLIAHRQAPKGTRAITIHAFDEDLLEGTVRDADTGAHIGTWGLVPQGA